MVVSNGLFRVSFEENFRKAKLPKFYVGERLGKRISREEAFRQVETRFGGIKLSSKQDFYAVGSVVGADPYALKFNGRFYLFWVHPKGCIDDDDKRNSKLTETVLVFELSDVTAIYAK